MLNYETLLSSYDDKLTLLQWLKKVEKALKDASAVSFNVNKRGDATLTFSVVFEDGSELETGPIILQQGESVSSASIVNGHLILMLTNGNALDAGDLGGVSGFSIDASQHLIVTYQNGTTQDLGAVFDGATIKLNAITSDNDEIQAQKPIIQTLSGFEFTTPNVENEYVKVEYLFAGVERNGNKITFSLFYSYLRKQTIPGDNIQSRFVVPAWLYNKLVSTSVGGVPCVSSFSSYAASSYNAGVSMPCIAYKNTGAFGVAIEFAMYRLNANFELNTTYYIRHEVTFLIGENLVQ